MARSVSDAVLLLSGMTGIDPKDTASQRAAGKPLDYAQFLQKDGLRGARIGVARNFFGNNDEMDALIERALGVLRAQGAILVDPVEVPNIAKYTDSELTVLLYEFKAGVNEYLQTYAPNAPVKNMADVIAFNLQHKETELAHFGQEYLLRAEATSGLDNADYLAALANGLRYSQAEGIDQVMREHRLDALVAPTGSPAWLTDYVNGDHSGAGFSTPAAVAGYPHITVPAGLLHGLPVGLSFVAGAWAEPMLIKLAYGFEQASLYRRAPAFARSSPRTRT
jgi:amidase